MNPIEAAESDCSPNLCVPQLLGAQAGASPDALAFAAPNRPLLTYNWFQTHVNKKISTLNALGLSHNDRIAVVLPNGAEMATAFFAVSATGKRQHIDSTEKLEPAGLNS